MPYLYAMPTTFWASASPACALLSHPARVAAPSDSSAAWSLSESYACELCGNTRAASSAKEGNDACLFGMNHPLGGSGRGWELTGTAGQLLDVFKESLGAKLQPFDHCEVWEKLIREILYRHAVANRERRGLHDLAPFGCDDLRSEQTAGAGVRNQLDEAARVEVDERPRNVVESEGTTFGRNVC